MKADLVREPIDLAHEAPFCLGSTEVVPSSCEVAWGGSRETLQPRVMQVLVCLVARRGTVVSHDDLVATCWGGRIVGDDAIHRCIGRLRRLAGSTGSFTIETIPRIGYRLDVPPASGSRPKSRAWRIAILALVFMLAVLAALAWRLWTEPSVGPRVQVLALQSAGGRDADLFAGALQENVMGVLTQTGIPIVSDPGGTSRAASRKADMVLRGSVVQSGASLEVRIFLEDVKSGLILWSGRFQRSSAGMASLADEVAVAATETVYTVLEPNQQKGLTLDPTTLALLIRGADLVRSPQFLHEGEPRQIFEQIVARAPNFAGGHGVLAVSLSGEARRRDPASRAAVLARATDEAKIAIRIDPHAAGSAYDALSLIQRTREPRRILDAENIVLDGLNNSPDYPFLVMRECRLLAEVGRIQESLSYCQRALALRPLAGPIGYSYARALQVGGRHDLAMEAIERAARFNPDHRGTRLARFQIIAFDGNPGRGEALLRDPAMRPGDLSEAEVAGQLAYLHARKTGQPSDRDRAARAIRSAIAAGGSNIDIAVMALTVLGRLDDAFDLLRLPALDRVLYGSGASFLLDPSTAPLRADPRFWHVAAEIGLSQYWVARDKWPDLCGVEIELSKCKTEARGSFALDEGRR
jgi:DNA-binding winged helix-turn-helix (wHTH) protein/tetratricopeptide (TPR) repeat protein